MIGALKISNEGTFDEIHCSSLSKDRFLRSMIGATFSAVIEELD